MGLFTTNAAKIRTTYTFLTDILDAYKDNYDSSIVYRRFSCSKKEGLKIFTPLLKSTLLRSTSTDTTKDVYLGAMEM